MPPSCFTVPHTLNANSTKSPRIKVLVLKYLLTPVSKPICARIFNNNHVSFDLVNRQSVSLFLFGSKIQSSESWWRGNLCIQWKLSERETEWWARQKVRTLSTERNYLLTRKQLFWGLEWRIATSEIICLINGIELLKEIKRTFKTQLIFLFNLLYVDSLVHKK